MFNLLAVLLLAQPATLDVPDCEPGTRACEALIRDWSERLEAVRTQPHGWSVGCNQDRVTREWMCFATKFYDKPHRVRVQFENGTYCVSAAMNDQPGNQAVIRIGNNTPIRYTGSAICGDEAKAVIEQMRAETDGAARGVRFPSQTQEFVFDLVGFDNAFRVLQQRVASPQP